MKRLIFVAFIIFFSFLFGCTDTVKKTLPEASVQKLVEDLDSYLQGLSASHVLVENYEGKYDLEIEHGEAVKLIEVKKHRFGPLSLNNEENRQISECICEKAFDVLRTIQICLNNGYYENMYSAPSAEEKYGIYMDISKDGIELFQDTEAIDRVDILIHTRNGTISDLYAVRFQNRLLIPNGLIVWFTYKDGTKTAYNFGTRVSLS